MLNLNSYEDARTLFKMSQVNNRFTLEAARVWLMRGCEWIGGLIYLQ